MKAEDAKGQVSPEKLEYQTYDAVWKAEAERRLAKASEGFDPDERLCSLYFDCVATGLSPEEAALTTFGWDAATTRRKLIDCPEAAKMTALLRAQATEQITKLAVFAGTKTAFELLAHRFGWKQVQRIEVDDVSRLTDDELIARAAAALGGTGSASDKDA